MKTFEAIAQALLDSDMEQGHAASDTRWGSYESNARAVLEVLKQRGVIPEHIVDKILKGEA